MRGTDEYNRPETEIESDSEAHNLDHLTHGIMSKAKMNSKKIRDRPNYQFKQKKVGFKMKEDDNAHSPEPGGRKSSDNKTNSSSNLSRPSLQDNTTFRDRSAFDDSSSFASRRTGMDLGAAFKSRHDLRSPAKVISLGNFNTEEYQFNNLTPTNANANNSDLNDSKIDQMANRGSGELNKM